MIEGSFLHGSASNGIVLGVGIAGAGQHEVSTFNSSLQSVHVGDHVTVTLRGGMTHVFTVTGIYQTDLSEANSTAFISFATADRLTPAVAGTASTIYVRTKALGDERSVIKQLRRSRADVRYQSWQTLASAEKDVTGSFNVIKSILNAVSLVVAAATVFIVTYVDLMNRRRTMGIERAIGVSGSVIIASYGIKAVVFAAVGVLIGAGFFFGGAIPLVNHHPFQFPIGPVTLDATMQELQRDAIILVIVSTVGALVPAWRAAHRPLLEDISGNQM
jgi:putative ABC transport system permease protein